MRVLSADWHSNVYSPLPEWLRCLTFSSVHCETCMWTWEVNDDWGFLDAFEIFLPGKVILSLAGSPIFQGFINSWYLALSTPPVLAHDPWGRNPFSDETPKPPSVSSGLNGSSVCTLNHRPVDL